MEDKAKKTIVYMNNAPFSYLGGGEKHLLLLAKVAKEREFAVYVICQSPSGLEETLKKAGIETIPINFMSKNFVSTVLRIAKKLKFVKADILHTHGFFCNVIGRIAGRMSQTLIIISTVHCNPSSPLSFNPSLAKSIIQFFRNKVDNFTAKFTDAVIAVSEDIKRGLVEQGVPKEKIEVICNGISLKELNEVMKGNGSFNLDIKQGEKVVGFLGRLEPVKGIDYFIKAAEIIKAKFDNVKFVIAGDGSIKSNLEKMVKQMGLTNDFIFTGYVDNAVSLISKFDVFVLPSLSEGLNLSLVEALAIGRAVVATNVGGNSEVVIDGETGLLVPPKNAQALADTILFLLENPEVARKYGEKGKRIVAEKFSAERMRDEHLKLYSKLTSLKN